MLYLGSADQSCSNISCRRWASAKVALIGHGLGGLTALLFAQRFPDLVDRVMTVNVPFDIQAVHSRLRSPASPADLADWLLGRNPIQRARPDGCAQDRSAGDPDVLQRPG